MFGRLDSLNQPKTAVSTYEICRFVFGKIKSGAKKSYTTFAIITKSVIANPISNPADPSSNNRHLFGLR